MLPNQHRECRHSGQDVVSVLQPWVSVGKQFPQVARASPCNPVKNRCVHARGAAAGSGFGISCGQMYICYPPTDF